MSYDDKKFGELFPTRSGTPSGTAKERTMLDTLGGAASFRTRIERTADGDEVMVRTHDGMPRFTRKKREEAANVGRTFVFAPVADRTNARIANRNGSGFKVVAKAFAAALNPTYTVLPIKTQLTVKWRDVVRLDGPASYYNAAPLVPGNVVNYGTTSRPGLPTLKAGTFSGDASGLFVGSTEFFTSPGDVYDPVFTPGVVQYNMDGTVACFVVVETSATISYRDTCGVYLRDTGVFEFYWRGHVVGEPGSVIRNGYCAIAPLFNAPPAVVKSEETAFTPEYPWCTVTYDEDESETLSAVGEFRTLRWMTFVGPIDPDTTSYSGYYSVSDWRAPMAPIYNNEVVQHRNKTARYFKEYQVGGGVGAVSGLIRMDGEETFTSRYGKASPPAGVDVYVYPNGTGVNLWVRQSNGLVQVTHEHSGKHIYYVSLTSNSDFVHGGYRTQTVAVDYTRRDAYDAMTHYAHGAIYVYIPSNPKYSATSEAKCRAAVDARNAVALEGIAEKAKAGPLGDPLVTVTQTHAPGENVSVRHDTFTLTMATRDFIFYDPDNAISVSLCASVLHTRSNTAVPLISADKMPESWNGVRTTHFKVWYELDLRGEIHEFDVYESNDPRWWPYFSFGEAGEDDIAMLNFETSFSGLFHPGTIDFFQFAPRYMSQGMCPYIAYTTLAEEAAGATPEFYMDFTLLPDVYATNFPQTEYQSTVLKFRPLQLSSLFLNHMGMYAPDDPTWDLFYEIPKRITYATGMGEKWVSKLGEPYIDSTNVTITRI